MEGSSTEKGADTAGGAGRIIQARMATAQETHGSVLGLLPGGTVASRGNTWEVTSATADDSGAGGNHGAGPRVRDRLAVWRENPVGKFSGVGGREGGREAS